MPTIEHTIPAIWAEHIKEVRERITALERQAIPHQAALYQIGEEIQFSQKHLGVLLGQLAKAEGLPDAPYHLSEDGLSLIGETEEE